MEDASQGHTRQEDLATEEEKMEEEISTTKSEDSSKAADNDSNRTHGKDAEEPSTENLRNAASHQSRNIADEWMGERTFDDENEIEDLPVLITEHESTVEPPSIEGFKTGQRHILVLPYVLAQLQEKFGPEKHGPFGCSILNFCLIGQSRDGFQTIFHWKCNMCHLEAKIEGNPTNKKSCPVKQTDEFEDVNKAFVAATHAAGVGHAELEQIATFVGIDCVSASKYARLRPEVDHAYIAIAEQCMKEAASEERRLAKEKKSIHHDMPAITVQFDGAWVTPNNRALAGRGIVVGAATHKVIDYDVRIKYCAICHRVKNQDNKPKEHICHQNWGSDQSAASMESNIAIDLFKRSIDNRGMMYLEIISDGDSSVFHHIQNIYFPSTG